MSAGVGAAGEQVEELLRVFPAAQESTEAGVTYYLLPALATPTGCAPATIDALLCPTARDGYPNRLFYAQRVEGLVASTRNWNANGVRILERSWWAPSVQTAPGLRLVQMVRAHLGMLGALTNPAQG